MTSTIQGSTGDPVQFISLKGQVQTIGMRVEEITRTGIDGSAFRQTGRRGKPYQMVGTVDVNDAAAAHTLVVTLTQFRGQKCTVVDDYGHSDNDAVMLDLVINDKKPLVRSVGGLSDQGKMLVICTFTFQRCVLQ